MQTDHDLEAREPMPAPNTAGTYFVRRAFFVGGARKLHLELENQAGVVRAQADSESNFGEARRIQPGTIVRARLTADAAGQRQQVRDLAVLNPWELGGLQWVPGSWVLDRSTTTFRSLAFQLAQMKYPALRGFIVHALADPRIGRPFLQVRASQHNHHAYAGGLFEHSVECAEWASTLALLMGMDPVNSDATLVGALFHDLGKVMIHTQTGYRPDNYGLSHEQLTLELLAQPLRRLESVFPAAVAPLRSALVWRPRWAGEREHYLPRLLISLVDQCSAANEKHERAFEAVPDAYARAWLPDEQRWVTRIPPQNRAPRIVDRSP